MVFAWLKRRVEAAGLLIAKVTVWLDVFLRSMVFKLVAFTFSLTVLVALLVEDAFSWERAAGYFVIAIVAVAPLVVICVFCAYIRHRVTRTHSPSNSTN